MSKLLLTFYGDDLTGSTDGLEQLANFGIRAMLFIEPPTPAKLKQFANLQAVGVAGMTRSIAPEAMECELKPALKKLKTLGARHVHYKVCSTFDSSPAIGSIGCAIAVAAKIFSAPFVPLLVAAPALGRFTVFGNHFARFGIGSGGEIHRLDRHPSISQHPVTPMLEADLRLHLAKQTKKKIALFDILKISLSEKESHAAFKELLLEKPDVILFDALNAAHLQRIASLIDEFASVKKPLFSVGASGIETALAGYWKSEGRVQRVPNFKVRASWNSSLRTKQILVGSGSCSPVTEQQIGWALKNGFAEVALDAAKLSARKDAELEIRRAMVAAAQWLNAGRSVIVHTTRNGSDRRVAAKLKDNTAGILGTALGRVLRGTLEPAKVRRLCVAGGDTSSFAARALGLEALEMIAPLTPGAPLCRAFARGSPADGLEVVFKGGQVGAENYFGVVKNGKT